MQLVKNLLFTLILCIANISFALTLPTGGTAVADIPCLNGWFKPSGGVCPISWTASAPSCPNAVQGEVYEGCDLRNFVTAESDGTCALATGDLYGLSVTPDCSFISGIPSGNGAVSVTITVTDSNGSATSQPILFTIAPPGSGPISPNVAANIYSGPAPLFVHFDATGSTHSDSGVDMWKDVAYEWDSGDTSITAQGNWLTSGKPKKTMNGGALFAHAYETPGNYTLQLTIRDSSGNTAVETVSISVFDPDAIFSNTSTTCISSVSNFSDCPSGANQVTSIPTFMDDNRYLLRAGETFSGMSMNYVDNIHLGKYGTGVVTVNGNVTVQSSNPGTPSDPAGWSSNIVIQDLYTTGSISVSNGENVLIINNVMDGRTSIGTTVRYYFEIAGSDDRGFTWPKTIGLVNNVIDVASSDGYDLYCLAENLAVIANDFDNPNEHNIRCPLAYKTFIAHNHLKNPGNSKHHIKIHSQGLGEYASSLVDSVLPRSKYIVVSSNTIGDSDDGNNWAIALAPQNDSSAEGVEFGMVELNNFLSPLHIHEAAYGGRYLVTRDNNTGVTAVTTTTGSQAGSLPVEWRGPYYIDVPLPTP